MTPRNWNFKINCNMRTRLLIIFGFISWAQSIDSYHDYYDPAALETQYYELNSINGSGDSNYSHDSSLSLPQTLLPTRSIQGYQEQVGGYDDLNNYSRPNYAKAEKSPHYWRLWKRHPYGSRRRKYYRKGSTTDPTYSRADYVPSRRRHKDKWIERQGGFFDGIFDEFPLLESVLPELPVPDFLLRGLEDYVDEEDEEEYNSFWGYGGELDEEEPEPEFGESYHRPWTHYPSSYERNRNRFRDYDYGIQERVHGSKNPKRRLFGRYAMKRFFGKKFKFLLALLLLPLILLFIPIPIVSSPNKTSRDQTEESESGGAGASGQWGTIHEFGRRVLSSQECIERIACEINRFQHANGPESSGDQSFTRFARFVRQYGVFFPNFLVRVARGYGAMDGDEGVVDSDYEDDSACSRFTCQNVEPFTSK